MLGKTGLLIVSNPKQIGKVLLNIDKKVQETLYIHLLSALSDPFGCFHTSIFDCWPKYSSTIKSIYTQAASCCNNLDVRVLLAGLKHKDLHSLATQQTIDIVIFDKKYQETEVDAFLKHKISNIAKKCQVLTISNESTKEEISTEHTEHNDNVKVYNHTVMGGTFDRLHIAHKVLLTEMALRSSSTVTIGVTEEFMLENKILWELIEPLSTRMHSVKDFLIDICPELEHKVVPISDPFGPTKDDPTMDLLIVSDETVKGGQKVNEVRISKSLKPLDVVIVNLVDEPCPQLNEESKISSSTARMRLLGTLINPVEENKNLPSKPYIIGLTGGIASGKSSISKRLQELGAEIIDCDKLAHQLYAPGKSCYNLIVNEFGKKILLENGEINRKVLGSIVFSDKNQLQKLNSLVWPAIGCELQEIVKKCEKPVVVAEAAVLLQANWKKYCHEIWCSIIAPNEAIKRLISRNNLTEEEAKARLNSQPGNKIYTTSSNVVFCTFWEVEYTRKQIDRAWTSLQERIKI